MLLDDSSIELAGVISFEPVGNTSGSPYYNARLAVRGGTANELTLLFWHHPSS